MRTRVLQMSWLSDAVDGKACDKRRVVHGAHRRAASGAWCTVRIGVRQAVRIGVRQAVHGAHTTTS